MRTVNDAVAKAPPQGQIPNDTQESLVERIQIIQRELPLDILEFSLLTPLPGSEDHAKAVAKGIDIDPDLN